MKLRKIKDETLVAIPKNVLEYLGWKNGDQVILEADKDKNIIIMKMIKKEN